MRADVKDAEHVAIAVIAIEHNLSLFALDGHFTQIPGVKLHKNT